ncbi:MAG: ABC transporter substrate-binding protein [Dehalococcoidia bacterium]|nr:ABC transporter substrate-binding protein [Dehalococcoidia bacterium]
MDVRRFRISAVLAIATVASLVLGACGGGDSEPAPATAPAAQATAAATTAPTAQPTAVVAPTAVPTATRAPVPTATPVPKPTGTMRIALDTLQDQGLHPDGASRRRYLDPMFDWMAGSAYDGKLDPKRGFVVSWTANADFKVWTVKTRDGVVFHNGDKATAADVKGSLEYTTRPGSQNSAANNVRSALVKMDVPDANTVVFSLATSRLFFPIEFLSNLDSQTVGYLVPTAYLKAVGDEVYAKKPVGSGPYVFKENVIGDKVVFQAVDYAHWYYGVPKFATYDLRVVPEATTRLAVLRTGGVDVANISNQEVAGAKAAGMKIILKEGSGTAILFPHQQWEAGNPLGNVKVRQALSLAIDRQALVDLFLAGTGAPAASYLLTIKDVAFEPMVAHKQNMARAKQLLAESGLGQISLDAVIYSQDLNEGLEMMEAIIVWWEQIGIKVNRVPLSYPTHREKWFSQAYKNPTISGVFSAATRPISVTRFTNLRGKNSARVTEDPDFVTPVQKVLDATTVEEYIKAAREISKLEYEKTIYIPLTEISITFAVNPKVVPGWFPGFGPLSYNVLDMIDPSRR